MSKLFCLTGTCAAALEELLCILIFWFLLSVALITCIFASASGFFLRTGVDVERVRPDDGECLTVQWLGDSNVRTDDSKELRLSDTQLESLERPESWMGPVCGK